jgi:hypothetical protein
MSTKTFIKNITDTKQMYSWIPRHGANIAPGQELVVQGDIYTLNKVVEKAVTPPVETKVDERVEEVPEVEKPPVDLSQALGFEDEPSKSRDDMPLVEMGEDPLRDASLEPVEEFSPAEEPAPAAEEASSYNKTMLRNKTNAALAEIADGMGLNVEGMVKREMIQTILDNQ